MFRWFRSLSRNNRAAIIVVTAVSNTVLNPHIRSGRDTQADKATSLVERLRTARSSWRYPCFLPAFRGSDAQPARNEKGEDSAGFDLQLAQTRQDSNPPVKGRLDGGPAVQQQLSWANGAPESGTPTYPFPTAPDKNPSPQRTRLCLKTGGAEENFTATRSYMKS
jgi:hypothetical protein